MPDRVTEVLEAWREQKLIDWQYSVGKKEARAISTKVKKIGTRVHQLIEQYIKEGVVILKAKDEAEVRNAFEAFKRFSTDYEVKAHSMEVEVSNKKLDIVGHYDFFGEVNGVLHLLDWKTSSQISIKNFVQVNVYAWLAGIELGELMVGIVRLDKNLGDYEFEAMPYDTAYVDAFKSLLHTWRFFEQRPKGSKQKGVANGYRNSSEERGVESSDTALEGGQIVDLPKNPHDRPPEGRQV